MTFQAQVTFCPHSKPNAKLAKIGEAIAGTQSSLLYSLAFLYESKGVIRNAITEITDYDAKDIFVYGISDKAAGGLDIQESNGDPRVAYPAALLQDAPPPFKAEATGGNGTRLHHKLVVIDFNTSSVRVRRLIRLFSRCRYQELGESVDIKDQRTTTSYAVEAVAMFDHYSFREEDAKVKDGSPLKLKAPPGRGV